MPPSAACGLVLGTANDSNGDSAMSTTRSTPRLRRLVGLVAVPALRLTAAACGDDDDDSAGGGSFCEGARALDDKYENNNLDDPTSDEFGEALDAFTSLDPPEEIADDWATFVEGFRAFADVDLSDPEAIAEMDTSEFEAASERIETYMTEECGL